jgi:superfamily I DNA/RNA helicase
MTHITKAYGPPGTGKTWWELERIAESLKAGVPPINIGYFTFTKSAAQEGIERATKQFSYEPEDFPHFRTIHSECFRALGLTRNDVVSTKKLKEFGQKYGYDFSEPEIEPDPEHYETPQFRPVKTLHDHMLTFASWYRHECLSLERGYDQFTHLEELPEGWGHLEVYDFCVKYRAWKHMNGLYDFTDMLVEAARTGVNPRVKVILFDESQDLSPLQWWVVQPWEETAEIEYLAGDVDQCLYSFASAHPELFLNRPCTSKIHLTQCHRFGRGIYNYAQQIIRRNSIREDFEYLPKDDSGFVTMMWLDGEFLEDIAKQGSLFILARNIYLLSKPAHILRQSGIPFVNKRGADSHTLKQTLAVEGGLSLATQGKISVLQLDALLDFFPQKGYLKRGAKSWAEKQAKEYPDEVVSFDFLRSRWFEPTLAEMFMTRDPMAFIDGMVVDIGETSKLFLRKVIENQGVKALYDKSNVVLCTGHGIKGNEADNVVILQDMSRKTYTNYIGDTDRYEEENRVSYVEVSRARRGVYIMHNETPMHYHFPPVDGD